MVTNSAQQLVTTKPHHVLMAARPKAERNRIFIEDITRKKTSEINT